MYMYNFMYNYMYMYIRSIYVQIFPQYTCPNNKPTRFWGAWSAFFTAGFVISGAAILVNFLSGVVADLLEDADNRNHQVSR